MDDFFGLLLFLVFIVGPIIERALKGAKGQQPQQKRPPQRRPVPGPPPGRVQLPRPETRQPVQSRPAEVQRDATDLIPSELWEILTGQKRPEPAPLPAPTPAPSRPVPASYEAAEEESDTLETAGADTRAWDEESRLDELLKSRERRTEVTRRVDHTPPMVVSLETEPQPGTQRHAAFHKKYDRPAAKVTAQRKPSGPLGLNFEDRNEMQRAFLMQEVFGKPKGFED